MTYYNNKGIINKMYNYIKCKYSVNLTDEEKEKLDRDIESLTFVCDAIENNIGEFLIRGNGELCHNTTEFEKVSPEEVGEPGVIWNGKEYAKVKNSEWVRVNFTGKTKIETQIISKKTDASFKIEFEFNQGYVVDHSVELLFIDNTERLAHDKKIKEIAVQRAKKYNSRSYRAYNSYVITPLVKVARVIGYVGSYLQDFSWYIEKKLNKLNKQ